MEQTDSCAHIHILSIRPRQSQTTLLPSCGIEVPTLGDDETLTCLWVSASADFLLQMVPEQLAIELL